MSDRRIADGKIDGGMVARLRADTVGESKVMKEKKRCLCRKVGT